MNKRHPSARRTSGEKDNPDDVFVAKTIEISTWVRRNSQIVILLGVALVVLAGGFLYWRDYRGNVETQAVAELEQIQQGVGLGNPESTMQQLRQYVDRYGDTPFAAEARLVLARLQLENGQVEAAISTLRPVTGSLRDPLSIQSAFLLAGAYEEAGEWSAAEELYLDIANRAELTFQIREALADAARLRQRQGNLGGAAELYEEILSYFEPGEAGRGVYEMRLAEVRTEMEA